MRLRMVKLVKSKSFILLFMSSVLFVLGETSVLAQRGQGGGNGQRQGQQRGNPSQNFDRVLTYCVDSLGVNADQEATIKEINGRYVKKAEALRSEMQGGADREAMRDKFRAMMKSYDTEVAAVLTKEQKAKYDVSKKQRRTQAEQQRKSHNGGSPQGRGNRGNRGGH